MATLSDLRKKYSGRIAPLDMELLFSFVLGKPREFVLAHPEYRLSEKQQAKSEKLIQRRTAGEPIAYILGRKEFYGLDFKVTKNTLIPRPETGLLVELALGELRNLLRSKLRNINVIDIGTGSGNIIISLAHNIEHKTWNNLGLYGTDISSRAITTAKQNAKVHKLNKKIKFFQGNLLEPVTKKCSMFHVPCSMVILANLPYLASKIYARTPKDVKDYEPKSALYSSMNGLSHYIKLLKQMAAIIQKCSMLHVICYMEISPEQKPKIAQIIKEIVPKAKIVFYKDLSKKWRVCEIKI